jgi:hypothetical protein
VDGLLSSAAFCVESEDAQLDGFIGLCPEHSPALCDIQPPFLSQAVFSLFWIIYRSGRNELGQSAPMGCSGGRFGLSRDPRDGFRPRTFHRGCEDQATTLTVTLDNFHKITTLRL